MREKLIKLIREAKDEYPAVPTINCCKAEFANFLADRLLANGVIVPPCDVGYPVYRICKQRYPVDAHRMHWEEDWAILTRPFDLSMISEIGKTVFLTREEAERELKGEHHAEIH